MALPDPLVPADVDLSGFSSFMLDVDRLLASELVAIGTPEECWAAVMLWCRAWKQQPAGSLPDDPKVLAAFSGARQRWPKVRDVALRGFVKCSDGRLYHKVLAAEANEAWSRRLGHRETVDNKTERQNRWRQRVKEASETIRAMGLTPPKGASLETLERLVNDAETPSHVDVSPSQGDVSEDGGEIGKTGQDRTGQRKRREETSLRSVEKTSPPATNGHPHSTARTGSRLPADWQPNLEDRAFAEAEGLQGPSLTRIVDSFRDYWLGKPGPEGRKADWSATWRNWIRREISRPAGQSSAQERPTRGVHSALAGIEAFSRNES